MVYDPTKPYFEYTHYFYTPKELDVITGKGPGCHDYDRALCNNGSFHFKRSKTLARITCPICRERLGLPFRADIPPQNCYGA